MIKYLAIFIIVWVIAASMSIDMRLTQHEIECESRQHKHENVTKPMEIKYA